MRSNLQETANLVTFTEEILIRNFLSSAASSLTLFTAKAASLAAI